MVGKALRPIILQRITVDDRGSERHGAVIETGTGGLMPAMPILLSKESPPSISVTVAVAVA